MKRKKEKIGLGWKDVLLGMLVGLFLLSMALKLFPKSKPEPPPPGVSVRLEVLNGCGMTGLAAALTRELRRRGENVDVVKTGNATTMDYDSTVIIDRGGGKAALDYIGWLLGCNNRVIEPYESPQRELPVDLTVIVGLDFPTLFQGTERKWWRIP